jgi:tRNA threonylcarbamoyladenosine biosynthesis protein TsaB
MPADRPEAAGPPVLVLAIESATPHGSVALVTQGGEADVRRLDGGSRMSESFLRAVDLLLAQPGAGGVRPTHVAVSAGPGSFTGLRVGMAAAKGFCFGWGVPLVPVGTLHALAWRFRREGVTLCPIQDARKGELYSATFRLEAGRLLRLSPDRTIAPDALAASLPPGPVLFCGDAVPPFREFLGDRFGGGALFPPPGEEGPCASAIGGVALEILRSGAALPDPSAAVPCYVRQSEAEARRAPAPDCIPPPFPKETS